MTTNERTVAFGHVDEDKLGETLSRQQEKDNFPLGSIADGIPQFTQVPFYTTFRAEYALQDDNLIVHFFLPPELNGQVGEYWTVRFPRALDLVARRYFSADRPRLTAKYTEELKSWWLRAMSYGHIVDFKGFVTGFFDELDHVLETTV